MRETNNLCNRGEELVAYLYGEATRAESRDFEGHLRQCASCHAELTAFGSVREAVGDWRSHALGPLTSPALEADAPQTFAPAPSRSAIAALREFFTLSPAWLRATTAALALLFCGLSVVAVLSLVRGPQTVVVEKPVNSGYTDKEVERMIAEALKKREEAQAVMTPAPVVEKGPDAAEQRATASPQLGRDAAGSQQTVRNRRARPDVVRRTLRPRVELASADYLPFTASEDDERLPSLADLADDASQE